MASKGVDAALLALALVLAACQGPAVDAGPAEEGAGAAVGSVAAASADAEQARPVMPRLAAALPVPFGSSAAQLRRAWTGSLLAVAEPESEDACYYLLAQPSPREGFGRAFMFEGGRLVRMDVDDPRIEAPGGARVGLPAAELAALYGQALEQRPHKYVEQARYLRLAPQGQDGVLVLETDSQGRISQWRIGVPPQVDYVEGCS